MADVTAAPVRPRRRRTGELPGFLIGLDIGQSVDFTAAILAEWTGLPRDYSVRDIYRFRLGTPYPAIIQAVCQRVQLPEVAGEIGLVVDATGVGMPIVQALRAELKAVMAPADIVAVHIHGGSVVSGKTPDFGVPKRDLVSAVQLVLQTGRLHIARQLPEASTLASELLNFRIKIDPLTSHDAYSAWREGQHDDLVLALAMVCWLGERKLPRPGRVAIVS